MRTIKVANGAGWRLGRRYAVVRELALDTPAFNSEPLVRRWCRTGRGCRAVADLLDRRVDARASFTPWRVVRVRGRYAVLEPLT